jgi:elongation factor Tu
VTFEERPDASSLPDITDQPFLMPVEDTFVFPTGGVVATGRIVRGTVKVGQDVEIIGLQADVLQSTVSGIEMLQFKNIEDWVRWHAQGINGLYFRGLKKGAIQRGQVLAAPGTIRPYTTFLANVTFFATTEAIYQQPYSSAYRTQFHIWSGTVFGTLWLPDGKMQVAPGDCFDGVIELSSPVALEVGQEFGIGRMVGQGVVIDLDQ